MTSQGADDMGGKAAGDFLRDLRMCSVPVGRLGLHAQFHRGLILPPDVLQYADVDYSNKGQATLRRALDMSTKHFPMVREGNDRQTTDRCILAGEEAGGDAFAVPLIRADRTSNIFLGADGHCSNVEELRGNVGGLLGSCDPFDVF